MNRPKREARYIATCFTVEILVVIVLAIALVAKIWTGHEVAGAIKRLFGL